MKSWIKYIYNNSLKYSSKITNLLIINIIVAIFNTFSKRILKTDNSNIITKSEVFDDYSLFYITPLKFENVKQDFDMNIICIKKSMIDEMAIRVPQISLFMEPPKIIIKKISVELSIFKKELYDNFLNATNSYFLEEISNTIHSDIIDAYNEINLIISGYVDHISLDINTIEILFENLTIIATNIIYNKNLITIGEIIIYLSTNENYILLKLTEIYFDIMIFKLSITTFFIDFAIINELPVIYTSNNKDKQLLDIEIGLLYVDDIIIEKIKITIDSPLIIIYVPSRFVVHNIMDLRCADYMEYENILVTLNFTDNIINFITALQIKIGKLHDIIKKYYEIMKIFSLLCSKFIELKYTESNKIYQINNIVVDIIYGDDIFNIMITHIYIDEIVQIKNIKIFYYGALIKSNMITIDDKINLMLYSVAIESENFNGNSNLIQLKTSDAIYIQFNNSYVYNPIELLEYIHKIIKIFKSPQTNQNTTQIIIIISILNASFYHKKCKIDLLINQGTYNLIENIGKNIDINISIDSYLINTSFFSIISPTNIIIEKLKIYVDPLLFNKVLKLCIIELPINNTVYPEHTKNNILDVLSQSSIMNSIYELHDKYTEKIVAIVNDVNNSDIENKTNTYEINYLINSVINLQNLLIENYIDKTKVHPNYDIKIKLESIHLYLFDEIKNVYDTNKSFLCGIFKNIKFKTITLNNYISKTNLKKFFLKITNFAIIDTQVIDFNWKYFLKFVSKFNVITCNITQCDKSSVNIDLHILPFIISIREETLLKLSLFITNISYKSESTINTCINNFNLNTIDVSLNFYPSFANIFGGNKLSLYDFKIKLSSISIAHINSFNILAEIIIERWKKELNLNNVIQFAPNIKIIKPCADPLIYFIRILNYYFKNKI